MNHAKPPKLCWKCLAAIERHARAETARNVDAKYCPHRNALAIVDTEGGGVINWTVCTCPDEATAVRKIREANADMLARIDEAINEMVPDDSPKTLQ